MTTIEKFTVKKTTWERFTFVGPASERNTLLDELDPIEYKIVQSGPYYTKETWPTVDIGRFLLIVEREVTEKQELGL